MTVASTISSVAAFIVGVLVGAMGCALVGYCAYRKTLQKISCPHPAAPLYDVAGPLHVTAPPPEPQLQENIAYGQVARKNIPADNYYET